MTRNRAWKSQKSDFWGGFPRRERRMTSHRAWKTTPGCSHIWIMLTAGQPYLDQAYHGPSIPGLCIYLTQKHIVSGQQLTKNQECHQMGRRATVLSIRGGENDPTGLPEPLGLFLDPQNGQTKLFCPPLRWLEVATLLDHTVVLLRSDCGHIHVLAGRPGKEVVAWQLAQDGVEVESAMSQKIEADLDECT